MLLLEIANYLGNLKKSLSIENIHVSLIAYSQPDFLHGVPQWHAHKNSHLTFFLEGGTLESRKNKIHKRHPGEIAFYNAGEAHLNTGTSFPLRILM